MSPGRGRETVVGEIQDGQRGDIAENTQQIADDSGISGLEVPQRGELAQIG
jgi:hypothetical protein